MFDFFMCFFLSDIAYIFSLRRVSYVFVLHLIVFKMSIAQGVFGGLQEVISFSLFFVLKKYRCKWVLETMRTTLHVAHD